MNGTEITRLFVTVDADVRKFQRGIERVERSTKATRDAIEKADKATQELRRTTERASRATEKMSRLTRSYAGATDSARAAVQRLDRSLDRLRASGVRTAARLKRSLGGAFRHVGGMSRRLAGRLGGIAKAGVVGGITGGIAGVAAIGYAGKNLFDLAAEAGETQNKLDALFGANAKPLIRQLDQIAEKTAMGRYEARDAAATFGALLKPSGLSNKEFSRYAGELVAIGNDMASFFNTTFGQAAEAIGSGLAGEMEPLKKFGVRLSVERVNAEAISMGLVKNISDPAEIVSAQNKLEIAIRKTTKAQAKFNKTRDFDDKTSLLSAQEAEASARRRLEKAMAGKPVKLDERSRAMAVVSLIRKDASTAMGDAARTADSAANVAKNTAAAWRDFRIELGTGVIPVVTKLLKRITAFLEDPQIKETAKQIVDGIASNFGRFLDWLAVEGPQLFGELVRIVTEFGTIAGNVLGPLLSGLFGGLDEKVSKGERPLTQLADVLQRIAEITSDPAFKDMMKQFGLDLRDTLASLAAVMSELNDLMDSDLWKGVGWINDKTGFLTPSSPVSMSPTMPAAPSVIDLFKSLFSDTPGAATGGTVNRSGGVIVGERGPELLSLGRGARITPLDGSAGGTSIVIHPGAVVINSAGVENADRLADLVARRIERRVRAGGYR